MRLALKALSWQDKEIQPRFPSDHSLDLVAAIVSAKGPGPKSGSGWWRQLLNSRGQCRTVGILAKTEHMETL